MTFPIDTADRPFALPRGGKRSRDKGQRGERAVVHLLNEHGLSAMKCSAMYKRGPDILFQLNGQDRTMEVKLQGSGFTRLYRWLEGAEFLALKADRREPLVVMRLSEFAQLVKERGP